MSDILKTYSLRTVNYTEQTRAYSMNILHGALVFRDRLGNACRILAPTEWREVTQIEPPIVTRKPVAEVAEAVAFPKAKRGKPTEEPAPEPAPVVQSTRNTLIFKAPEVPFFIHLERRGNGRVDFGEIDGFEAHIFPVTGDDKVYFRWGCRSFKSERDARNRFILGGDYKWVSRVTRGPRPHAKDLIDFVRAYCNHNNLNWPEATNAT